MRAYPNKTQMFRAETCSQPRQKIWVFTATLAKSQLTIGHYASVNVHGFDNAGRKINLKRSKF